MLFKSFVCRHVDLCTCTCVSQSVWRSGIIAQESVYLIFLNILLACCLPLFFLGWLAKEPQGSVCVCSGGIATTCCNVFLFDCFLSLSCVPGMNSSLCCPFCKAVTFLIDRYLLSKIQCFDLNFLISIINIQENFIILKTEGLRYIYKAFYHLSCYHPFHFYSHNWCQKGNGRFIQILAMSYLHCVNLDYEGLLLSGIIPGCDLVEVGFLCLA